MKGHLRGAARYSPGDPLATGPEAGRGVAMFRAVHIGDLHFWRFTANPALLPGKRLLGLANLALRRSRAFQQGRAGELVARIGDAAPDRILLSGDFTTTSLPSEFSAAKDALAPLEERFAGRIRAVPGNHDRYTRRELRAKSFDRFLGDWCFRGTWPWFDDAGGGLWIAGIDATTSNGLGCFGTFRDETLEALKAWRSGEGADARELWIVCHFPTEDLPGVFHRDRGRELHGGDRLLRFLGELNIPVFYLHGHHHYRWIYRSPTHPNVTYLNAGAPMYRRKGMARADLGFLELLRENGTTAVKVHRLEGEEWKVSDATLPEAGEYFDLQTPGD